MQSPREILAGLWTLVGGDSAALDAVTLTGEEPQLPSSFRVAAAAQVSIAAAGLAAAHLWKLRSGKARTSRSTCATPWSNAAASVTCASMVNRRRRHGTRLPVSTRRATSVLFACTPIFPYHRDAVCRVLGCKAGRDEVQAALMQWDAESFETAAYVAGGVVAMMRSHDEWSALPQAKAVAALPVIDNRKDRRSRAKAVARGRPAACGFARARSVARDSWSRRRAHAGRPWRRRAADLRVPACRRSRGSPSIPAAASSQFCRSQARRGQGEAESLLAQADIFSQGYRPRALADLGFSPQDAARINPGIVYVSLSAYGHAGPWAERRGFDSLVQAATGFNHAEGQAVDIEGPKELPAQILDHASGYLMAFAAMMAKARQSREGGSWHVRVSLAQTGRWIWNLGRLTDRLKTEDLKGEAIRPFVEETPSGFGQLRGIRHSATLSKTPAFWSRPAMPLGSHPPQWPARR